LRTSFGIGGVPVRGISKYYAIFDVLENESGGRLSITPDYTVALEELHEKFTSEIRRLSEIEDGGFVEGWG
jgi:hypothetical protein